MSENVQALTLAQLASLRDEQVVVERRSGGFVTEVGGELVGEYRSVDMTKPARTMLDVWARFAWLERWFAETDALGSDSTGWTSGPSQAPTTA